MADHTVAPPIAWDLFCCFSQHGPSHIVAPPKAWNLFCFFNMAPSQTVALSKHGICFVVFFLHGPFPHCSSSQSMEFVLLCYFLNNMAPSHIVAPPKACDLFCFGIFTFFHKSGPSHKSALTTPCLFPHCRPSIASNVIQ